MSEYETKAIKFLAKHGITLSVAEGGYKKPLWAEKGQAHGNHYRITFQREPHRKRFSLSFWNSVNDVQEHKHPSAYDVLTCLQKSDVGSFEEFCCEFGYDCDSIKALKTYKATVKEWEKVSGFFTPEEIEELQGIQ